MTLAGEFAGYLYARGVLAFVSLVYARGALGTASPYLSESVRDCEAGSTCVLRRSCTLGRRRAFVDLVYARGALGTASPYLSALPVSEDPGPIFCSFAEAATDGVHLNVI